MKQIPNFKLSPSAIHLLKQAKQAILVEKKYDQERWCGTNCCIAGHICEAAGMDVRIGDSHDIEFIALARAVQSEALRLLGLSEIPSLFGFFSANDDVDLAAELIDQFIELHS